jgi:Zn-dependent peptidase ImmA (M78 family)/plasmid maintenance system antidote protein VapI
MDERSTVDWFSKPGDSIRVMMQRRGMSSAELASSLEDGMNTLRAIYDGSRAIDDGLASALATSLGGSKAFWLKRQENFETALARAVDAAAKNESGAWLRLVPSPTGIKTPAKITEARLHDELRRRLVYFNVPKLDAWERRYGETIGATRFRTSKAFTSSEEAVLLWLRRGEMEAELAKTGQWKPGNLRDRIEAIRKLTKVSKPRRFLPILKSLLAEVGVALVVVKAPAGCRASGATRMVSPDKAMLLMSFRHRADDQFWFTLFHEIGHLVLHQAATFVDDDNIPRDEKSEKEANDFASFCIVPMDRTEQLEELPPSRAAVIRFSVSVGISPGLTVGQMQHRKIIEHNRLNHLKRRWTWEEIEPALV